MKFWHFREISRENKMFSKHFFNYYNIRNDNIFLILEIN